MDRMEQLADAHNWNGEVLFPILDQHAAYHKHWYVCTCRSGQGKMSKGERDLFITMKQVKALQ